MNQLKNILPLLGQLVKYIPAKSADTLARKYKIRTRSFSPTSHVVAMMYAQLSHSLSLNDVCDALQNHHSYLSQIRNCAPPNRNGLSHARIRLLRRLVTAMRFPFLRHSINILADAQGRNI